MILLVGGILITVLGIVILVLSIYAGRRSRMKRKRCTSVTEGTLVRFEQKEYISDNIDGSHTYREHFYYPVYEYVVGGLKGEVQSSYGKRYPDEAMIGQKKQICYNPYDCYDCYIAGEDLKLAFKIIRIVAIILIAIGILSLAVFTLLKLLPI